MNTTDIFDGEPHILSESYGYIANKVHDKDCCSDVHKHIEKQIRKYCEYLYENNKEKTIDYLMQVLMRQVDCCSTDEDFKIIFRPAYLSGCLSLYGTVAIKFKRAENDNLKDSDE